MNWKIHALSRVLEYHMRNAFVFLSLLKEEKLTIFSQILLNRVGKTMVFKKTT
jgi:hypothetical protein